MALAAFKTCGRVGCPALIRLDDGGYCAKHAEHRQQQRRKYDRQRNTEEHRAIYKSSRWLRIRALKIADNSFCEMEDVCVRKTGRPAPSTVVDHIIGTKERPDLAFDWDNLRACCKPCHDARTAREESFHRKA